MDGLSGKLGALQISRRDSQVGIDDMPPKIWVNRILQECAATN
jgi:hypothetical protein